MQDNTHAISEIIDFIYGYVTATGLHAQRMDEIADRDQEMKSRPDPITSGEWVLRKGQGRVLSFIQSCFKAQQAEAVLAARR